jgi:hypothetical protein
MANPFSGLENIGQSYLQGVQLANQRQARQEAIAQRQEEARVRERYYQDIIGERQAQREALRRQRMDQFASVFGKNLKLTPEGDVDIPASAFARDRAIQEEQLASAEGELGALYGTQAPLSPEIIASPAYQTGKLRGTAKRLAQEKDLTAAMIRRGFIPADQEQDRELPDEVRNQIEDISTSDIFSGEVPVAAAPTRAGAPMGGGQRVSFGGRQYFAPTPTAKRAEKAGSIKYTRPSGEEVELYLTPEMAREEQARLLASPDQKPDLFADLDAAQEQLMQLRVSGEKDFNLKRLNNGTIQVVADDAFSIGRTAAQIQEDLKLERKNREQILKESKTMPGPEAGLEQGTNRVQPLRQTPVTLQTTIPGLPKLPGR